MNETQTITETVTTDEGLNDELLQDQADSQETQQDIPNIPLQEYTPKNHSIKVAILAIFTGLGVALSSLFIYIPNVELMTLTIFIGGIILGPVYGSFLAVLATSLYEIVATALIGLGGIIYPFKVIAFLLVALTGAMIGRNIPSKPTFLRRVFMAVIGGLLTIAFDLITNFGWVLISSEFQWIGYFTALLTGLPITASKVVGNSVLFFFIPDILNRAVKPFMIREKISIIRKSKRITQTDEKSVKNSP